MKAIVITIMMIMCVLGKTHLDDIHVDPIKTGYHNCKFKLKHKKVLCLFKL